MKIFFLTYPWYPAPYVELLKRALLENDESVEIEIYSPSPGFGNPKSGTWKETVLHIQWPDTLYNSKLGFWSNLLVILRFLRQARQFKKNGGKVVWTVHEYSSHNCKFPLLDKFFYQALFLMVDNFIVHTEAGKIFLVKRGVASDKISIIPHGNFIGYHGDIIDIKESRKKLGIFRDDKVFINIGYLCDYKGLDNLVDVFNRGLTLIERGRLREPSENPTSGQEIKLIIAGKKHFRFNLDRLLLSVRRPDAISISDVFLKPEEISSMLGAADFFIMAHKNFLSSGAAILALSYGLPVIAPAGGDMSYLIKNGYNGFLYKPGDRGELKKVVLEAAALSQERKSEMSKNALESIKPFSWDYAAKETLKIYQG